DPYVTGVQTCALPICQLLEDHVALQAREVIDEDDALQVIHLVLDAGGEQALEHLVMRGPLLVEPLHPAARRALDIGELLGDRQEIGRASGRGRVWSEG